DHDSDVIFSGQLGQIDARAGGETLGRVTDACRLDIAENAMRAVHFYAGALQFFVVIKALQAKEIHVYIEQRNGSENTVTVTHAFHFKA
ncbi:hypothetical protein, partial [Pseudomonas viridiflava]|uniref:hypothetical protein n=1 Tax=Pseudomonas viridiflava TaxID=33069 RepID=UPI0013CE89A5